MHLFMYWSSLLRSRVQTAVDLNFGNSFSLFDPSWPREKVKWSIFGQQTPFYDTFDKILLTKFCEPEKCLPYKRNSCASKDLFPEDLTKADSMCSFLYMSFSGGSWSSSSIRASPASEAIHAEHTALPPVTDAVPTAAAAAYPCPELNLPLREWWGQTT